MELQSTWVNLKAIQNETIKYNKLKYSRGTIFQKLLLMYIAQMILWLVIKYRPGYVVNDWMIAIKYTHIW